MEIIRIVPSESKLWEQAWRLYTESFPEHERRRISSHELAVDDPHFDTKVAVENGNLLGLLFYWRYGKKIYVEHIAVNPLMRGRNIGSTILSDLMAHNADSTVILEIDPPVDETSQRRLAFYERLGFHKNGYTCVHPSYQKKGLHHDLVVLSYPTPINDADFDEFREFMNTRVLKYID